MPGERGAGGSPWFTTDLCVCRPTGSTDCICFTTVGTSDAVTSALHIIVGEEEPVDAGVGRNSFPDAVRNDPDLFPPHSAGDSQPMDVSSVHRGGDTLLGYSASLLGYGFYGDVLTESERNRRLGPARYDLAGTPRYLDLKQTRV